jgi:hypothetical protein
VADTIAGHSETIVGVCIVGGVAEGEAEEFFRLLIPLFLPLKLGGLFVVGLPPGRGAPFRNP